MNTDGHQAFDMERYQNSLNQNAPMNTEFEITGTTGGWGLNTEFEIATIQAVSSLWQYKAMPSVAEAKILKAHNQHLRTVLERVLKEITTPGTDAQQYVEYLLAKLGDGNE